MHKRAIDKAPVRRRFTEYVFWTIVGKVPVAHVKVAASIDYKSIAAISIHLVAQEKSTLDGGGFEPSWIQTNSILEGASETLRHKL